MKDELFNSLKMKKEFFNKTLIIYQKKKLFNSLKMKKEYFKV